MSNPNWEIRIGGTYAALGSTCDGVYDVEAIDGSTVHFAYRWRRDERSKPMRRDSVDVNTFRIVAAPADESPIMAMTALLEKLIAWDESPRIGSELNAIMAEARELLANQAVHHATS